MIKQTFDKFMATFILAGMVILGGFFNWITSPPGQSFIGKLFNHNKIYAISVTRTVNDWFLAEEKIRVSVQGLMSEQVYWSIDEKAIKIAGIETELKFVYDSTLERGVAIDHRVTAFVKTDGTYVVLSLVFRVYNVPIINSGQRSGLSVIKKSKNANSTKCGNKKKEIKRKCA